MLSLFRRTRSIRHRTFGTLTPYREDRFWRGRVAFGPAGRRVWVTVPVPSGRESAGPTEQQERLYLQLAQRYHEAVLPEALRALHREYQRVRRTCTQTRYPAVERPADLLRLIPLDEIWLDGGPEGNGAAPGHKFVLSYQSRRHKDHDFHVFFKDWQVESVASER